MQSNLSEKIKQLDPVLDAIWHYEVISRDKHMNPFETTPLYEAVLCLQESYLSEFNRAKELEILQYRTSPSFKNFRQPQRYPKGRR